MRLRIATYNTSMADEAAGALAARLATPGDPQARSIAAVLQRVRPDIVLLNEFDHDHEGRALDHFLTHYLSRSQQGDPPLDYPYRFQAPVNTGEPSGLDINGDGRAGGPEDAHGFGRFPGQYGMVLLSRHPIDVDSARTFQTLRWSAMPGALKPVLPDGSDYYATQVWSQLRLSSKSHWDVPIDVQGVRLHLLAAHPTPPAFDGPEDRNGRRNHDEIRLWVDYLDPARAGWIRDDQGRAGGLAAAQPFVILGDLNADPVRGSGQPGAIRQLLEHPRIDASHLPQSKGAIGAARRDGLANPESHRSDTADFREPVPGNLRVDYVLPSRGLRVRDTAVFWPSPGEEGESWIAASDHRLVWLDLEWP